VLSADRSRLARAVRRRDGSFEDGKRETRRRLWREWRRELDLKIQEVSMTTIDVKANKSLAVPGQANLAELAAAVRAAHAGVQGAHTSAIERAPKAGEALVTAKAMIPHKQFGDFLRLCDVGPRQSQRYIKLYQLSVAKTTTKSDLAGLSIEEAIRLLSKPAGSSPKPHKERKPRKPVLAKARASHIDVLTAWLGAAPEERSKAIDSIGLEPLLAAIPPAWLPVIEQRLADRRHVSAPKIAVGLPADLSIPNFLRRDPPKLASVKEAA
jgi:hypothetical protein